MSRSALLEWLGAKIHSSLDFCAWGAKWRHPGRKILQQRRPGEEKRAWGANWQLLGAQITARMPINTSSALGAVTFSILRSSKPIFSPFLSFS